jgi:hypothetical protein
MPSLALLDPPLVAGATFVLAAAFGELAGRLGARLEPTIDDRFRSQIGALQGAVIGLVGLLLAFSFSIALARFDTRRDLVTQEANAIGTTWLRTDALAPGARTEARALLRDYVATRVEYYEVGEDRGAIEAQIRAGEALQARIWGIAEGAAVASPGSLPLSLLVSSLNDAIDLAAGRIVAHDARVPGPILALQIVLTVVGVATVAFGFGLFRGPHRAAMLLLATLMAGILVVILDLDHPRDGWIRVSQEAMLRLQRSLD